MSGTHMVNAKDEKQKIKNNKLSQKIDDTQDNKKHRTKNHILCNQKFHKKNQRLTI